MYAPRQISCTIYIHQTRGLIDDGQHQMSTTGTKPLVIGSNLFNSEIELI